MARTRARARATAVRRHEAFAREYVRDHNASAAYRRAGFTATGHAAEVNAARMLRKAEVQRMIDKLERDAAVRANVDVDELLRTSVALAHVDPVDLFDEHGNPKPIHEIPKQARLAISGFDITEEYTGTGKKRRLVSRRVRLRLLDKNAALDRLFKYKGMFAKDNEQKVDVIRQFMEAVSGKSRGLPGEPATRGPR